MYIFGVFYFCQEEALRGHGDAGGAAVFALYDFTQAVEGEFAATHVEQGAGDGTHHVAQEPVAGNGEDELVAFVLPAGVGEMADIGFHLGVEFGKAGKVVVLHEYFRPLVHEVEVGPEVDAAVEALEKGQSSVADAVLVGARRGVETSVGVVLDGEDVVDGDVVGQETVEFEGELRTVDGLLYGEVGVEV